MGTIHDSAPIYALGVLDGEDLDRFEAHMRSGCDQCRAALESCQWVVDQLAYATVPVAPPPETRERLLARVREDLAASGPDAPSEPDPVPDTIPSFVYIRSHEGLWGELAAGIHIKQLYTHPARDYSTALVRMAPGTYYPRHRHLDTEEIFVLEGDCHINGQVFGPGDYHRAAGQSLHEVTHTKGGCMFLVIASGGGHTFE